MRLSVLRRALPLLVCAALAGSAGHTETAPPAAEDGKTPSVQRDISECRKSFPDVVQNPSSAGGVAVLSSWNGFFSRRHVLCFYGSLEHVQAAEMARELGKLETVDTLVVRSTGGAVTSWLTLAEALAGKVEVVAVDDICVSSCANYAFFLGDRKVVPENGLVVWHGGPYARDPAEEDASAPFASPEERDDYNRLVERTAALYRKLGVSTRILRDTSELTLGPEEREFLARQGEETDEPISISGFAIDPAALSYCYGVTGLEDMWHPGFFQAVFDIGRRRSSDLQVLMRPGSIQDPPCGQP